MLDRLEEIAKRHDELLAQQADPVIAVDQNRSRKVAQKLAELQPVVRAYHQYTAAANELEGAREIVAEAEDDEMREMAEIEVGELTSQLDEIEQRLKLLLLPADPNDRRNVILEIRAGTGGEEAALFASELLRMYGRYAEGEALLGWLNCTVEVDADTAFSSDELLLELTRAIAGTLQTGDGEIAHLKMTLESPDALTGLSAVSQVRSDDQPHLRESLPDPIRSGQLIINLRAEADHAVGNIEVKTRR